MVARYDVLHCTQYLEIFGLMGAARRRVAQLLVLRINSRQQLSQYHHLFLYMNHKIVRRCIRECTISREKCIPYPSSKERDHIISGRCPSPYGCLRPICRHQKPQRVAYDIRIANRNCGLSRGLGLGRERISNKAPRTARVRDPARALIRSMLRATV